MPKDDDYDDDDDEFEDDDTDLDDDDDDDDDDDEDDEDDEEEEDDDDDEDEEDEEADEDEEDVEEEDLIKPPAPLKSHPPSAPPQEVIKAPLDLVSLDQIPLEVHLEVAKLQISLDELQRLQPGHKLPIEINPRIVRLLVNGKAIGTGEIMEFGDIVGVKILELYRA